MTKQVQAVDKNINDGGDEDDDEALKLSLLRLESKCFARGEGVVKCVRLLIASFDQRVTCNDDIY